MTQPDLEHLPLADADQCIRDQMAHHREQLAGLRRQRAERLRRERDSGRPVADIAAEIGTSVQVVYELIREVPQDSGGS